MSSSNSDQFPFDSSDSSVDPTSEGSQNSSADQQEDGAALSLSPAEIAATLLLSQSYKLLSDLALSILLSGGRFDSEELIAPVVDFVVAFRTSVSDAERALAEAQPHPCQYLGAILETGSALNKSAFEVLKALTSDDSVDSSGLTQSAENATTDLAGFKESIDVYVAAHTLPNDLATILANLFGGNVQIIGTDDLDSIFGDDASTEQ
jgi:hypothetical protein